MINRSSFQEKTDIDSFIYNLFQEKLLSENEVRFICEKVNLNHSS